MKHKRIIKAWLDGETVEYLCPFVERWKILDQHSSHSSMPSFADNREYRIKPKLKYSYSVVITGREGDPYVSANFYKLEKAMEYFQTTPRALFILEIGNDGSVEVLRKKEGL